MPRKGRDLEQLVAYLEGFAGPKGMIVTSPDYITGKLTGSRLEVDVTLRYKVGSTIILIAFECRKRKDTQGPDWIGQLVTRKEDIGANAMIAVSSTSFSAGAIRLAKGKGIELRQVDTFAPGEVEHWFGTTVVEVEERHFNIDDSTFILEGYTREGGEFQDRVIQFEESIVRRLSDGKHVSLRDIISTTNLDTFMPEGLNVPPIEHQAVRLRFKSTDEQYYLVGKAQEYRLKGVLFHISLNKNITRVPLKEIQHYRIPETEQGLARIANFPVAIGGKELVFRFIKDEKTGKQSIAVTINPGGSDDK